VERSAIILAGGLSRRLGKDKGLVELAGKPLIIHVLDRVSGIVDESVVVVGSSAQRAVYSHLLSDKAGVIIDKYEDRCSLVGALTGFESVRGEYSLLLPCDTPFVSTDVASLLLDVCLNRSAAIPRWPDGRIEPLQAAYHTKYTLMAAETALGERKLDLRSMISHLRRVRYVSTLVLQQVDPNLSTFFNINTPLDLKRAESMLK